MIRLKSGGDPDMFKMSDLDEERTRAREEASIAKAAGFEWVNVSVFRFFLFCFCFVKGLTVKS